MPSRSDSKEIVLAQQQALYRFRRCQILPSGLAPVFIGVCEFEFSYELRGQ